jgi:HlyD family secretion protein
MNRTRKTLAALVALAVLAGLVLMLRPAPVPVTVATAERGPFVETVVDEGRTRLRDPYVIRAPVTGFLHRVSPEPGDPVEQGATLFRLEPQPAPMLDARARERARNAVEAARMQLERARAEAEAARARREGQESAYQRRRELADPTLISKESLDRMRTSFLAARAEQEAAERSVAVARFELRGARAALAIADGQREEDATLAVSAPIAGTVTERHRCCQGPVNAGEPILAIGDMADLEVQVDLLSMDAVRVQEGMRVELERWGGSAPLEGVVRRVKPAGFTRVSALGVDEQRVPVFVRITSPRPDWSRLGEGYRVEARFILAQESDVLQVPASALFRDDDRWALFIVEEGRAWLRHVEPGSDSGLRTRIRSGIEVGAAVIEQPGDRLADGTRVRVAE